MGRHPLTISLPQHSDPSTPSSSPAPPSLNISPGTPFAIPIGGPPPRRKKRAEASMVSTTAGGLVFAPAATGTQVVAALAAPAPIAKHGFREVGYTIDGVDFIARYAAAPPFVASAKKRSKRNSKGAERVMDWLTTPSPKTPKNEETTSQLASQQQPQPHLLQKRQSSSAIKWCSPSTSLYVALTPTAPGNRSPTNKDVQAMLTLANTSVGAEVIPDNSTADAAAASAAAAAATAYTTLTALPSSTSTSNTAASPTPFTTTNETITSTSTQSDATAPQVVPPVYAYNLAMTSQSSDGSLYSLTSNGGDRFEVYEGTQGGLEWGQFLEALGLVCAWMVDKSNAEGWQAVGVSVYVGGSEVGTMVVN